MIQCYCAAVRRLSRRLTRMYEEELRPAGVSPAQFELMQHLHARPGLSQGSLAEAVDIDQTTLSRNLRGMVRAGWVTVSTGAKDRRVSRYSLTVAGKAVLQTAVPLWGQATAKVERVLEDNAGVWRALGALEAIG